MEAKAKLRKSSLHLVHPGKTPFLKFALCFMDLRGDEPTLQFSKRKAQVPARDGLN